MACEIGGCKVVLSYYNTQLQTYTGLSNKTSITEAAYPELQNDECFTFMTRTLNKVD